MPTPKKGQKIKDSSPFRFVKADKVDDAIFDKTLAGRKSLYAEALEHLVVHPDERLEVDNLTAKSGFAAQANKHGIRVLFAEKDGKLYVKVIGKDTPEQAILNVLAVSPLNMVEIEAMLAKTFKSMVVDSASLIRKLSEGGQIALQSVAGTQVKKWHLMRGTGAHA